MSFKTIRPLGNRVLVQREETKATKGGILLPESAQQKLKQGVVMAVGPGRVDDKGHLHPLEVAVGDRICFSAYGITEYKLDQTEYLVLSEDDVLAVLN